MPIRIIRIYSVYKISRILIIFVFMKQCDYIINMHPRIFFIKLLSISIDSNSRIHLQITYSCFWIWPSRNLIKIHTIWVASSFNSNSNLYQPFINLLSTSQLFTHIKLHRKLIQPPLRLTIKFLYQRSITQRHLQNTKRIRIYIINSSRTRNIEIKLKRLTMKYHWSGYHSKHQLDIICIIYIWRTTSIASTQILNWKHRFRILRNNLTNKSIKIKRLHISRELKIIPVTRHTPWSCIRYHKVIYLPQLIPCCRLLNNQ